MTDRQKKTEPEHADTEFKPLGGTESTETAEDEGPRAPAPTPSPQTPARTRKLHPIGASGVLEQESLTQP
jgi:hypothetical protein